MKYIFRLKKEYKEISVRVTAIGAIILLNMKVTVLEIKRYQSNITLKILDHN